jgi:hypothetical protein
LGLLLDTVGVVRTFAWVAQQKMYSL